MKISTNTFVVRTGAFVAGILVVFALSQLVQWSTAEAQTAEPTATFDLMKKLSDPYPTNLTANQFTFDISGTSASGTVINMQDIPLTAFTDDSADTSVQLPVGTYTITEEGPDGFIPGEWTVKWAGAGCENAPTGLTTTIVVEERHLDWDNFGCSADNQWRHGNLRVVKEFEGTTTEPYENFEFKVTQGLTERFNGAFDTDGDMEIIVAAGAYEVVETVYDGYTPSYENCSGEIAQGGSETCIITNTWTGGNGGSEIPGCTDPLANNYNPDATEDDGSCQYDNGGQCVEEPEGSWVDEVISEDQGLRLDNSSVLAERSNSNNVLGNAGGGFFSLGFGGEIVVEFDSYVPNVAGNDFTVYEVTNGDYPEESAEVYVSQNGAVWHLVGEANNLAGDNTTSFDFDSTGLDWINQIRLVDTTNAADFPGTYSNTSMPDGFDLDAIEATQQVCDEPGDGGNGGDEDVYLVYGYVWHDENENDDWEQEQPNPEDNETDLSGWTVQITNGEETHSTTTDADGYYYFYVPAGTWTINQVVMTNWEQTFPNVNGHVVVVGVDEDQAQAEPTNFFAQMLSFIVPTALAAQIDDNNACDPFCGPHDFGNVFRGDSGGGYSQGSYGGGNGTRIELTSSGGSNDDDDDGPVPQVLGEATSAFPQGAPYTGAGGAAPLSVNLPTLLAVLTTSSRSVRTSHGK